MSIADEVGALPGGDQFVDLWRQVDGNAGAVESLGGALRSASTEVQRVRAGLSRAVTEVHTGWRGSAASAFTAYMAKVTAATDELEESLARSAAGLRTAADEIASARATLNSVGGHILDAWDSQGELTRLINGRILVAEGCDHARPAVQRLAEQLHAVAETVTVMAALPGFLPLQPPGAHGYLPPKGKPIEWTALPKDGGTTGDGGSSGSGGNAGTGSGPGDTGNSGDTGDTGDTGNTGDSGGPTGPMPTGDVKDWIAQASKILEANGIPASRLSPADINMIIEHESSGNPHAENLTDSNAAAGHPSKGLMQCIDSTFNAHALPGHTDIWNPVDNIIAGVRYAVSRYGSLDNVPGVKAVHDGGSYVGY